MNRRQINRKQAIAFILMSALLLISGGVLLRLDYSMVQEKVHAQNQVKLDFAAEMIGYMEHMEDSSGTDSASYMTKTVRFMTMALTDSVSGEEYDGQRLFKNGAVAEVRGNQVIVPAGSPEFLRQLSAEDLKTASLAETLPAITSDGQNTAVTAGNIAGNYYYVCWPEENEQNENPYAYLDNEEFRNMAKQSFGGLLFALDETGTQSLIYEAPEAAGTYETVSPEVRAQLMHDKPRWVTAGGSRWFYTCSVIAESGSVLIWLMPASSLLLRSVVHVSLSEVSALIIFVTMIVYFFSVLLYCGSRKLAKSELLP